MTAWQLTAPAVVARETTAWLFGPVVRFLVGGPRVVGREHLEALDGPFLVAPNHSSHLDVSTVRLALRTRHRTRLIAAAAEDYFFATRSVRGFVAAWIGAIAFRRRGPNPASIAEVEALLAAGWNVLMFPEGTRSRSGEMGTFRPGIGLVAVRTGRPVLPVRIVGLHEVLPPGARLPRPRRVEVRFGAPLRALPGEDARAFTARLEGVVRSL